jgi:hypothetical protein
MIRRSSVLLAGGGVAVERSTSSSFFRPSGVSSKAQETISTGTSPMASRMVTVRTAASPNPKAGKIVSTTWMTSQLVTM